MPPPLPRRVLPRAGRRPDGGRRPRPGPPPLPMAPMAGSPQAWRSAPPQQRRRWVFAAAATGVMLTTPGIAGKGLPVPERSRVALDQVEAEAAAFVGAWQDAETIETFRPAPAAVGPVVRTAAPLAAGTDRGGGDAAADAVPVDAEEAPEPEPAPEADLGALPDGINEIARYGDVPVVAEGSTVELVGFHESSAGDALPLTSTNPVVSSHPNVPADAEGEDGPVVVLPPRHRAGAPTSAIDLSMAPGEPVVAPISGEVVSVSRYRLYGTMNDRLIRIRSDADPRVVATVNHIAGPRVEVGDRVEAGETTIAREARQLPFESQVDRFTAAHRGEASPHIHIELRYA